MCMIYGLDPSKFNEFRGDLIPERLLKIGEERRARSAEIVRARGSSREIAGGRACPARSRWSESRVSCAYAAAGETSVPVIP